MTDQPAPRAPEIPVLIPPRADPPRRGGGPAWLALLLALGAGGAAGWLWQANERLGADVAALRARPVEWPGAAALEGRLAESRQALDAAGARVAALEAAQQTLRIDIDTVTRELRSTRQDLSEAEYLLRLASQGLLMRRDVRGALELLEAADTILRQREDPVFHEARARLAEDIAALRGMAGFDVEGLYLRLSALSATLPSITFTEPRLPEVKPAAGDGASPADGDWLARAEAFIARFISIRRDAPAVTPLPTAGEEAALRANLRLLLEQAKLGLLSGEQKVYAGALADAQELLRARFGSEPAANRNFLEDAARLAGEDIAPRMPDLADALSALRAAAASTAAGGGG